MDEAADERREPRGSLARPGGPPRPGARGISGPIFVLELLIAMVAVFIVGLIAVNRFDRGEDPDAAES